MTTTRGSSEVETTESLPDRTTNEPTRVPEEREERAPRRDCSEHSSVEQRALASVVETLTAAGTSVVGIGIDVVGITAFAEQLAEPGTRFANAFTPHERRAAKSGAGSEAESLAARWAAKEAVIKAWSSTRYGQEEVIDPTQVDLREIEVRTDAWGRPAICLHGEINAAMTNFSVLVSLTHDINADAAMAFAMLRLSSLSRGAPCRT